MHVHTYTHTCVFFIIFFFAPGTLCSGYPGHLSCLSAAGCSGCGSERTCGSDRPVQLETRMRVQEREKPKDEGGDVCVLGEEP